MLDRETRQFKKELKSIHAALAEDLGRLEECLEIAKFYFLGEDYDKALKVEREILKYAPDDVRVQYNLATCLRAKGEIEEAKHILREILAKHSNHQGALKALEDLRNTKVMANPCMSGIKLDQILKEARAALDSLYRDLCELLSRDWRGEVSRPIEPGMQADPASTPATAILCKQYEAMDNVLKEAGEKIKTPV